MSILALLDLKAVYACDVRGERWTAGWTADGAVLLAIPHTVDGPHVSRSAGITTAVTALLDAPPAIRGGDCDALLEYFAGLEECTSCDCGITPVSVCGVIVDAQRLCEVIGACGGITLGSPAVGFAALDAGGVTALGVLGPWHALLAPVALLDTHGPVPVFTGLAS